MGCRGNVRTLGAIARQAERDSMKRARDHARHVAAMEKIEAKEQAAESVREYEHYVHRLVTIHHACSSMTDWKIRTTAAPPMKPTPTTNREDEPKHKFNNYKPSWITRLLGRTQAKREALARMIAAGKQDDERDFAEKQDQSLRDFADHVDEKESSERVLRHDPAQLEAVKLFEPLASIGLLGEHLSVRVPATGIIAVELTVHGEEVIPKDKAKLLASGRLSAKPLSKGDYFRLYQDHVCSAALRVAREILALLPVETVIVTAVDDLVDLSTGCLERTPILSFQAPRSTINKLNFEALDPSDPMRNFVHKMDFSVTSGFRRTSVL